MTDAPADRPLAVVTGAAHRVGRAIALELARAGLAIGLHYHRSEAAAQETRRELEALGCPVTLLPANLSRPDEIEDLFARVAAEPGRLALLVNSAAVMTRQDVLAVSADEWDAVLALNLRAPLLCAQAAARLMAPHGGLIVNITDTGSNQAWSGFAAYTVSKAALESLTRVLARGLAPRIRVNAVAPGLILPAADMPEAEWQRLVGRLPLGRPGSPAEVAQAVLFLWTHPYITGQTIVVDGGYQLL